jgi:hypothetical protein
MAKKVTGRKAASNAAKVLGDKKSSKTERSAAGSALSQREKRKKK